MDFQANVPPIRGKKPLKIALVNTWRVVGAKGGTEKVFCDMANALSLRGHTVTAICCDKNQGKPGFPVNAKVGFINTYQTTPLLLSKFAINVRSLSLSRDARHSRRSKLSEAALSYRLNNALFPISPDCIVAFQAETTHAVRHFFPNTPIVTMLHGNPEFYLANCPVFEKALSESDVIQFLRPEYEGTIKEIAPNTKAVYIPNPIPQFELTADRSLHTIIHVGRFDPNQKRQDLLIKAFALVKDYFPDWTLELWGEQCIFPAFDEEIEKLIAHNHLQNCVRLCGVTNHTANELKHASIFAFPSKHEGFPLALGEAMSMGLPAIGWEGCSAVNTLIKNNINGLLCDQTPEALAQALTKLMDDEELRIKLGNQAKQDMFEYAPSRIWDQWELLLYDLVSSFKENGNPSLARPQR